MHINAYGCTRMHRNAYGEKPHHFRGKTPLHPRVPLLGQIRTGAVWKGDMPMVSLKLMAGAARSMVVASLTRPPRSEIHVAARDGGGERARVVSVKRVPATVLLNRHLGECESLFLPSLEGLFVSPVRAGGLPRAAPLDEGCNCDCPIDFVPE